MSALRIGGVEVVKSVGAAVGADAEAGFEEDGQEASAAADGLVED